MNEINEVYKRVVQSPNAIICRRITLFLILFQLQNISQRLDASVRFFGELSYVRTTSDSKVSVDLYLLFSFLFFASTKAPLVLSTGALDFRNQMIGSSKPILT